MKQAHICLDETLGIRYAILPGDPARLDRIAKELEDVFWSDLLQLTEYIKLQSWLLPPCKPCRLPVLEH